MVWTGQQLRAAAVTLDSAKQTVLLHELGHAVGLAHTSSTADLMYPLILDNRSDYGAGDLAGLRRLGRAAGCL